MGNREEIELSSVFILKAAFEDFPAGVIRQGVPPQPDCLIGEPPQMLGIEVTSLHHLGVNGQRPPREQEMERIAVVDEAQELYERTGGPPLEVHVHFFDNTAFTKNNRADFAFKIARLVIQQVLPGRELVILEQDYSNEKAFPWEIDSISILQHPAPTKSHWSVPTAGWVMEDFADRVQGEIRKKEGKLIGYRRDCHQVWLLIVSQNDSPSTMFDPSEATLNHVYTSSFDKVIFLERLRRKVYEVKLGRP